MPDTVHIFPCCVGIKGPLKAQSYVRQMIPTTGTIRLECLGILQAQFSQEYALERVSHKQSVLSRSDMQIYFQIS